MTPLSRPLSFGARPEPPFSRELQAMATTSAPDAAPLVKQANDLVDEKLSELDKTIARADAAISQPPSKLSGRFRSLVDE